MKKMTNEYISAHIKSGVDNLTPKYDDILWEDRIEKASGSEWYLVGTGPKNKKQVKRSTGFFKAVAAVAACAVICMLSYYMTDIRVETKVCMDVNPSIELQLNQRERVVNVHAKNDDGEKVLENMDLKNTDVDVAVNAIIGSMVKHGYLSKVKNSVLLSVNSEDMEKANQIRNHISGEINDCLESMVGTAQVFNQNLDIDDEMENFAEEYGITQGKASLAQKITQNNPNIKYDEIANMPINDLMDFLDENDIDKDDYVELYDDLDEENENDETSQDDDDE